MEVETGGGGQALTDLFAVKYVSGAYEIWDVLTGTPAKVTTPTRATGKPLTLSEITKTKPQYQNDGTEKCDWENYDCGKDLFKFLEIVAKPPATATGVKPDYTLENGTVRKAAATGYNVLKISYLMNPSGDEIFVDTALGILEATSGSFETDSANWIKPTITFTGVKAEAAFTIPVDLYSQHASDPSAGMVDTTDLTTLAPAIAKGICYRRDYIPIPHA